MFYTVFFNDNKHLVRSQMWLNGAKRLKLIKRLLLPKLFGKFCPQYWLHCRWDKILLEGSDDLHSKDKTAVEQKHSAVIPQLSRAHVLQPRCNTEKTLSVCFCVLAVSVRTGRHFHLHPHSLFIFTVPCLHITQRQSPLGDQLCATLAFSISRCATCSQYWFHVAINW